MSVTATVENGLIVLPPEANWSSGTRVRIEPVEEAVEATLYDELKEFIGMAKDLPPDFAENHDHYVHGQPKR